MTEKLDLADLQDQDSEQTSSPEIEYDLPEDHEYSPSAEETEAFLADASPATVGDPVHEDARSKYGMLQDTEWPVHTYETKGGKTIAIKHDSLGTFWRIEFIPGGQMPSELKGRFTNDSEAKHAVEQYLAKQD